MKRWLVRMIVGGCVLLGAGVVLLWVRSYYVVDHLYGTRGDTYAQATSSRGGVRVMTLRGYPEPVEPKLVRRGAADEEDGNGRWVAGAKRVYVMDAERRKYGPVGVASEKAWVDFPWKSTRSTTRIAPVPATPRMVAPGPMDESALRAVTRPTAGAVFDSGFALAPRSGTAPEEKAGAIGEFLEKSQGAMTLTPPIRPKVDPPDPSKILVGSLSSVTLTRRSPGTIAMLMYSSFGAGEVTVRYWLVLVVVLLPVTFVEIARRRRARVRRRRIARGLCLSCGYDLRWADGVCPECGSERSANREDPLATTSSTRSPS